MPKKILIVEDQKLSRQLFEILLKDNDYEVVASIPDANYAKMYCMKYSLDLIIMDVVTKNGSSGLDASEEIKRLYPNVKIMIVTSMPECSYINRAKSIGVESFCYKDFGNVDVMDCVKRTLLGESLYPESTPVLKIGDLDSTDFTKRDIDVLRLILEGMTDPEIAQELGLSPGTVHNRVKDILSRTGFSSRTKLAVAVRETGFIINN